ncbi:ribosomal protein L16 [Ascodesmis nigricans]|uniref:Ribosomal protein L16 n=1 Tax=Ascodesmis nigricans TaxID=341454 RepID=A0A4S2N468_9PEZI|nr:ribosomal protein L16 [Ascodesmis nigricans]
MQSLRPLLRAAVAPQNPQIGLLCNQLLRTNISSPPSQTRSFRTSSASQNWLLPKKGDFGSVHKGRPRVHIGGACRGTTVVWGDYGVRMVDYHRRLSALQLKNAEETIKRKLRGMKYRLYTRIAANIPVYQKGNEVRMGTGKGSLSFWASRVPVGRVIFELKGEVHEELVKDAFRVACNKMPGKYEFTKKGDPPILGITKLTPENIKKILGKKHTGITSPKFPTIAKELAGVDVGKTPLQVSPKSRVEKVL